MSVPAEERLRVGAAWLSSVRRKRSRQQLHAVIKTSMACYCGELWAGLGELWFVRRPDYGLEGGTMCCTYQYCSSDNILCSC